MKRLLLLLLIPAAVTAAPPPGPEMMRGAQPAKPAGPTLIVGVNVLAGSVAAPGWPIIVSAASTGGRPVPAGLTVEVTDGGGKVVTMPFERTGDSWVAAESATTALKPGRYHFTLKPAGEMPVDSGELLVGPTDGAALGLLKIQRHLLAGKVDEALAEAGSHPESADAWMAKGDILLGRNLPGEALAAYDQALKLSRETGENLFLLKRRQIALLRSLEKSGAMPAPKAK